MHNYTVGSWHSDFPLCGNQNFNEKLGMRVGDDSKWAEIQLNSCCDRCPLPTLTLLSVATYVVLDSWQ